MKYIKCCNFWNINATYFIVYIFWKEMNQRIHNSVTIYPILTEFASKCSIFRLQESDVNIPELNIFDWYFIISSGTRQDLNSQLNWFYLIALWYYYMHIATGALIITLFKVKSVFKCNIYWIKYTFSSNIHHVHFVMCRTWLLFRKVN